MMEETEQGPSIQFAPVVVMYIAHIFEPDKLEVFAVEQQADGTLVDRKLEQPE